MKSVDDIKEEISEAIRKIYITAPIPGEIYIPKGNYTGDFKVNDYDGTPVMPMESRYFSIDWFKAREQARVRDLETKQVLIKDNTRDEAVVTYKKVGNEIVVTRDTVGDFIITVNRFAGEVGSKECITIPKEFGRLLGEALVKETETKTDSASGQRFFDSPEFQEAWARWVRRN